MPDHAVILLAEDEEDYILLIQQAFSKAKIKNPLYVVSTGQDALAYFQGTGKFANREEYPLPDLLLLDLKLPCYSGFEILAWIRSQPGLAGLRVLVLTSSDRIKDVNDAYRLGANSFLVKPYDFEDLIHFSQLIQEFWLGRSKCPDSFRSAKTTANRDEPVNPEIAARKDV
jgi:CheY-like chemotaxis protein